MNNQKQMLAMGFVGIIVGLFSASIISNVFAEVEVEVENKNKDFLPFPGFITVDQYIELIKSELGVNTNNTVVNESFTEQTKLAALDIADQIQEYLLNSVILKTKVA